MVNGYQEYARRKTMKAGIEQDSTLELDSDDKKILALIQNDMGITQAEIASRINKIQPAVGARILKLERRHLLATQYGIDLSATKLPVAIVRLYAKNSKDIFESITSCPYVLNAFTTLGRTNITVILAGASIERLEEIVEIHFRSNPDIKHVEMSVAMEPINHTILPVDFNMEAHDDMNCGKDCHVKGMEREHAEGNFEPTKAGTLGKLLKIDDDDKRIIMQLQKDPETTQEELGELIGKSQPAVGSRIAKLTKNGILGARKGVDYKQATGIQLMQVSISTMDVQAMVQKLRSCPIIVLGFRVVNENPLVIYIGGNSLEEIEEIVDTCIRSDENVKDVETVPVIKYLHDLILPYNFECDFVNGIGCSGCSFCSTKITKELGASMMSSKSATES
ncbi:MAG TPA: Lrp/AsnC family transcriptional regulator [Candidatus Lokiarchaeia archaeon]|nr:Lrp/AsnC family transcriptional regulator [Candidatus Lokiarchaeia archaeon]